MSNRIFLDPNFKHWKSKIDANGVILEGIECKGEVVRNGDQIFTALIDCQIDTPEGPYFRSVVLFSESVIVVPLLKCRENGGEYTLLVEQFRIAQGKVIEEFPAGMVDREKNDPVSAAAEEIREELGINLDSSELIPLTETPLYTIPSLITDGAHFFYFAQEVSVEFLLDINGRQTGALEENEFIRVRVHPLAGFPRFCKTIGAYAAGKLLEDRLGRAFIEPSEPLDL